MEKPNSKEVQFNAAPEVVPNFYYAARPPLLEADTFDSFIKPPTASHRSLHNNGGFLKGIIVGFLSATVIIGAALGGGLGSQLASCQRDQAIVASRAGQSTAQTTVATATTSTAAFDKVSVTSIPSGTSGTSPSVATATGLLRNYSPPDRSQVDLLQSNCTAGSTVKNTWGDSYAPSCGKDFNVLLDAAEGGKMTDIAAIVTYSLTDCLDACSSVNLMGQRYNHPSETRCRSVAFGTDMRNQTKAYGANCILKNGTLLDPTAGFSVPLVISAKLIT